MGGACDFCSSGNCVVTFADFQQWMHVFGLTPAILARCDAAFQPADQSGDSEVLCSLLLDSGVSVYQSLFEKLAFLTSPQGSAAQPHLLGAAVSMEESHFVIIVQRDGVSSRDYRILDLTIKQEDPRPAALKLRRSCDHLLLLSGSRSSTVATICKAVSKAEAGLPLQDFRYFYPDLSAGINNLRTVVFVPMHKASLQQRLTAISYM